jgi:parallel beta-helix repeat protein
MKRRARPTGLAFSSLVLLGLGAPGTVLADSGLCVDPGGAHHCATTIQAAIDAVSAPNTTIVVHPGTYTAACLGAACSVATISVRASNASALVGLTLQCGPGQGSSRPVRLDATGLDHAVYVSGVNQVTIEGCVAENAEREGILVEDSSNVTIRRNEVVNNDLAMAKTIGHGAPPCPTFLAPGTPGTSVIQCCPDAFSGGPGNFPFDNDDCGEGLHLRSVTASVVEGNLVHDNIGGILLTDETGPNKDNLVVDNTSRDNVKFGGDCGVTLPSHIACAPGSNDATGCTLAPPGEGGIFQAYGVTHNAVVRNVLKHNGAAGTGMFANPGIPPGAATNASGNLIKENVVTDNGEEGIGIHVHAANGKADHNVILENVVSGNGGDEEAEGAPAPRTGIEIFANPALPNFAPAAPIVGTVVSENRIFDEDVDVWVGNNATHADVFLNSLLDSGAIGVKNAGTGKVVATDDWWGCTTGPNTPGCSSTSGNVIDTPFLRHPPRDER